MFFYTLGVNGVDCGLLCGGGTCEKGICGGGVYTCMSVYSRSKGSETPECRHLSCTPVKPQLTQVYFVSNAFSGALFFFDLKQFFFLILNRFRQKKACRAEDGPCFAAHP